MGKEVEQGISEVGGGFRPFLNQVNKSEVNRSRHAGTWMIPERAGTWVKQKRC